MRGLRFATDSALLELFEDCRQRMRVRTTVGLVVTDRVKSPLLFGFFRFVRKIPNSKGKKVDYYVVFTLAKRDGRWLINNISQTDQNVKYVTRYTIVFSSGLRLETYLPPKDIGSAAVTGGFACKKVYSESGSCLSGSRESSRSVRRSGFPGDV